MTEREFTVESLCPERPFPALSACVRERGHDPKKQKCVFAKYATPTRLSLYEKGRGHTFHAIFDLELKPGARVSRTEAAALLAVAELQR